jgi:hypothetical protein
VPFDVVFSAAAAEQIRELEKDRGLRKRLTAVRKAIARLEADPHHPGLRSHPFRSLGGPAGEAVFESYAEQATPAAYRVFWHYGPGKGQITVVAVTPHP